MGSIVNIYSASMSGRIQPGHGVVSPTATIHHLQAIKRLKITWRSTTLLSEKSVPCQWHRAFAVGMAEVSDWQQQVTEISTLLTIRVAKR